MGLTKVTVSNTAEGCETNLTISGTFLEKYEFEFDKFMIKINLY